jgi:transposase InsO family protein
MIEPGRRALSVRRQGEVLGLSRSGWCYTPRGESAANQALMRRLMRAMGLEAIYPKQRLSAGEEGHRRYAYLRKGLVIERPEIFNSDQRVQFTAEAFTGLLEGHGVGISMDGRGRCFDNMFVERLWRTVKYEEVYLRDYAEAAEAPEGLRRYFRFYNAERPHQSLGYRTPAEVYLGGGGGGSQEGGAARRPAAGTSVALRAPSVPAAGGS